MAINNVCLYLVTTGWIFDISLLCEISIKKSSAIIVPVWLYQ